MLRKYRKRNRAQSSNCDESRKICYSSREIAKSRGRTPDGNAMATNKSEAHGWFCEAVFGNCDPETVLPRWRVII
jgi:hypothetical protein